MMKKTLSTIIALAFSAQFALAQQPKVFGGKALKEFILNYSGKDSVFFRNGVDQFNLILDEYSKEYQVYKEEDSYQSHKKPTIVLDEIEMKKALDYKNYVARYKNLDEAILDITRETEIKLPSIVENKVKKYFEVALQYFDKAKAGNGPVLAAEAKTYVLDCRDAARKVLENAKEENKYGLEYAIKFMDKLLSDVTTAIDLNLGKYKTSYNGLDLIILSMECNAKDKSTGYGSNVRTIARNALFAYADSVTKKRTNEILKGSFEILESKEENGKIKFIGIYKGVDNVKVTKQLLDVLTPCSINMEMYPQMQKF
jgi:hypothetical protein